MKSPVRFRPLAVADLPFVDSLRAIAGWNQTLTDWERFLTLQPDGCFLAELDGSPAGVATTFVYSRDLAWIGMLLVHPEFRRRGVGRGLFEHCLKYAREHRIPCVKLDATPEGQPLYSSLGFHEEWTLTRWQCNDPRAQVGGTPEVIKSWSEIAPEAIEALDSPAFGVSRAKLVQRLAEESSVALVAEAAPGQISGYGMLRAGSRAAYLGPVVAKSAAAGLALVQELLQFRSAGPVYWDIPDQNTEIRGWAVEHGFSAQRSLTRMYLGDNPAPGEPGMMLAIAGPELG